MPNYLELMYGEWRKNGSVYPDKEAWHPYPADPRESHKLFSERVRETESIFVNDGVVADGSELLKEIRALSEARHTQEKPEQEARDTGSYRYTPNERIEE